MSDKFDKRKLFEIGEFYDPSIEKKDVRSFGQITFLNELIKEAPEIWNELWETVFPFYKEYREQISPGDSTFILDDIDLLDKDSKPTNFDDTIDFNDIGISTSSPEGKRLEKNLREWGSKYNLVDEWILKGALEVLENWNSGSEDIPPRQFPYFEMTQINLDKDIDSELKEIKIEVFWEPQLTTEKEIRGQIEKMVEEKIGNIRKECLKKGLKPVKKKKAVDHFKWLVKYQVNPTKTYQHWAEVFFVETNTFHEAIHKLAKEINLTIKPPTKKR